MTLLGAESKEVMAFFIGNDNIVVKYMTVHIQYK